MAVGIYISVPFCRTKCTFCNFASGVVSKAVYARYVERVGADIEAAERIAGEQGGVLEGTADSIYLGGGTPTVLEPAQLERIFGALRERFEITPEAEVTVEVAPGTLTDDMLQTLAHCGVNRASLGVQSFVDEEAASVGRKHTGAIVLEDIRLLRAAGIVNISIDVIAGLPHQRRESWKYSLQQTIAAGVQHVSAYMLEVDEDSRLGRELIAGGTRYHAHSVPDEDLTADLYEQAVEALNAARIAQYEISNFAHQGFRSRHNLKYWRREPYIGFGVDAHSMLRALRSDEIQAVRFATPDSLEAFTAGEAPTHFDVTHDMALEERLFLELRLNEGVALGELEVEFGCEKLRGPLAAIEELCADGLLERAGSRVCLTSRGRLLSNEVFARFVGETVTP